MKKPYYRIDFFCPNQKCSERIVNETKEKLNNYVTNIDSQNDITIKLSGKKPSLKKEPDMKCACRWYIRYQNKQESETSNELFMILFDCLDPKIAKVKKKIQEETKHYGKAKSAV